MIFNVVAISTFLCSYRVNIFGVGVVLRKIHTSQNNCLVLFTFYLRFLCVHLCALDNREIQTEGHVCAHTTAIELAINTSQGAKSINRWQPSPQNPYPSVQAKSWQEARRIRSQKFRRIFPARIYWHLLKFLVQIPPTLTFTFLFFRDGVDWLWS